MATAFLQLAFLAILTLALFVSYFFTFSNVSIKVKKDTQKEHVIEWAVALTGIWGFSGSFSVSKGATNTWDEKKAAFDSQFTHCAGHR